MCAALNGSRGKLCPRKILSSGEIVHILGYQDAMMVPRDLDLTEEAATRVQKSDYKFGQHTVPFAAGLNAQVNAAGC